MKYESEQKQKELLADHAPVLGKWLWILFWLVVPGTIAGIMKTENILNISPVAYIIGHVMNTACSIAYGCIFLKLSSVEDGYRTAGICSLITAGVSVLMLIIFGASEVPAWSLIITIPAIVVALIREYNEYKAHSSVLMGLDNELSEKWTVLWKWYIRCTLGSTGSVLLVLIAPILGAILLTGFAIGIVIVGIAKLVYVYRTAKVFRDFSTEGSGQ